jgi:hypothetical protein
MPHIRIPGRSIVIAAVIALALSSGCAPRTTRTLGAAAAVKGQAVADAALRSYEVIEQQQAVDKHQQDLVKILTAPNPSVPALPDSPAPDFAVQLEPRVAAYRALREAYVLFQRLADPGYSEQASRAAEALTTSINSLNGIRDLPGGASTTAKKLTELAVGAVQAGKIREHNRILLSICEAYRELWEAELPVWRDYYDRIYKDFADPISNLSLDRFDAKAVDGVVKEPFAPPLRVQIYKLQMRDGARQRAAEIEAQLVSVGRAFRLLESVHAELAKQKPSIPDVTELLDQVRAALEPVR